VISKRVTSRQFSIWSKPNLSVLAHVYAFVQAAGNTQQLLDKGLDSAVSFAQSLSQWAYITIGASVALLAKDLKQRPKSLLVRSSFFAFLPGWGFLVYAIYKGTRVHGAYIAYLMSQGRNTTSNLEDINSDAASQLSALKWGLLILFVWLVIYLFWWVLYREGPEPNENLNRP